MKFDVTINTDNNYVQHAMATLCSLFENNKEHEITVHILQKDLTEKSHEYFDGLAHRYGNHIKYYTVDESRLQGVQFRKNRPLSMAAYYRLLLASTLPRDIEKVLYLDCDMIILRDITEIFHIELNDYALAATLDDFPYDQQHRLQLHMEADERTFCSGLMFVNLKYWRDHNVEPGLLEYAKRHRDVVYLHDQDVLNYFFKKKWFLLPPKWNRLAGRLTPDNISIYKKFDVDDYRFAPMLIHYASVDVKPWYDVRSPDKKEYLKYLGLSGFKDASFSPKSKRLQVKIFCISLIYWIKKILMKSIS